MSSGKGGGAKRPGSVAAGSAGTVRVASSNASLGGPHEKPMKEARDFWVESVAAAEALRERLRRAKAGVVRLLWMNERLGVIVPREVTDD